MNPTSRFPASLVSRRTLLGGVLAAPILLAACSNDSPTAGAPSSSGNGAGGEFSPVTIQHALGEAVIETKPERIVTLGQGSTETCIALGTIPVGMEEYPWGSDETGYMPWIHEAITEAGGELPTQFTGATELDVEAIVELAPDLILAPWSGVTQEQYDTLAALAPTVAYAEQPWVITWTEQIQTIAKALGQDADGEALIAEINQTFDEAKVPEWEQYTFSFIYNTGPGTLGVFFKDEQRVAMVRGLGLTVDPIADQLGEFEVEGTDSAMLGLENANKLDNSDLIFTFYSDEANRTETESQELYAAIPAIKNDAIVAPTDQPFVTGSSIINPLTVPWALERYRPMIEKAITKVPN